MTLSELLILGSTGLVVATTVLYIHSINNASTTPSMWMWSVLLTRSGIDALVYADLTDWVLAAPKVATVLGISCVVWKAVQKSEGWRFRKKNDAYVMAISFLALGLWGFGFVGPGWGNVIVLVGMTLAYIPKYSALFDLESKEHPLPWTCATAVNFLLFVAVAVSSHTTNYWAYVGPIVGTLLNAMVLILELRRRSKLRARLL